MKDTKLTLAEQLVWAVAFVTAHSKDAEGRYVGRRDDRLLLYAQLAAEAVFDLRRAKAVVVEEADDLRGRIDVSAASMLHQLLANPTGARKV
jgi:hypothetical protein